MASTSSGELGRVLGSSRLLYVSRCRICIHSFRTQRTSLREHNRSLALSIQNNRLHTPNRYPRVAALARFSVRTLSRHIWKQMYVENAAEMPPILRWGHGQLLAWNGTTTQRERTGRSGQVRPIRLDLLAASLRPPPVSARRTPFLRRRLPGQLATQTRSSR